DRRRAARPLRRMEEIVHSFAETVANACELGAIIILAIGIAEALVRLALGWRTIGDLRLRKLIWLRFATNLVLALEFALAADIADTLVAPTWDDIGRLAAIAAIRTVLNYFLGKDIESLGELNLQRPEEGREPG